MVCRQDPERRFPASCDAWRCEWCGPRNATKRAAVIAWAKPTRFATFTNAPTEWQPLRQKVRRLTMNVRRAGYRVEWAWTVERGDNTGMIHVHALQHGEFIPQAELQAMWGAIVDIRRVRGRVGAANYAMKEAAMVAGYAMKNGVAALDEHLDLNGGRGMHMSRGYLRGLRTREVEKLLWPTDPALDWILVPMGASLPQHLTA